MAVYAILLAGGSGSRIGGEIPKQFLKLGEESLLQRCVRRFRNWGKLKSLVVVCKPDFLWQAEKELDSLLEIPDRIVEGGDSRHDSVLCGIRALEEIGAGRDDWVFFQDVARPFFTYKELDSLLEAAILWGAATLATPNPDTLVRVEATHLQKPGFFLVQSSVSREGIYRIKTPQVASWERIRKLLEAGPGEEEKPDSHRGSQHDPTRPKTGQEESPSDLCTWCETKGFPVAIVETKDWNMKVTAPGDLELAKAILTSLDMDEADLK